MKLPKDQWLAQGRGICDQLRAGMVDWYRALSPSGLESFTLMLEAMRDSGDPARNVIATLAAVGLMEITLEVKSMEEVTP